ncbi:MAG: sulfurtransferase [Planctomycetota bacterium]|nr:sulfurtransferase [Planctomycetota bacterium]
MAGESAAMKASDWIVSVAWLSAQRKNVKIIDARWYLPKHGRDAKKEFLSGRIPGAIAVDLSTDFADEQSGLRNTLPDAKKISETLGKGGIRREDTVVVYDDKGFSACRVALILHLYGQESVAVLDGGYTAWVEAGHPIETGVFKPPEPVAPLHRSMQQNRVIRKEEMLTRLTDSQTVTIDARSALRFQGLDGEKTTGHMPGAVHFHYARCFKSGTAFFREPDELRALFEDDGVLGAKAIVSTCGSGVTASILLWALKFLGRDDVFLYDGSWDEWSRDDALPVERG